MPIAANAIALSLFSAGASHMVAIGVANFLVSTVSSIAMSALATAIRGKPDVRQPGITTETTTAGGTIPQRLIFGRYATAGHMVTPMMVYQTDSDPNEWLVYVITLADKPVAGLARIFVDGKALEIDGDPAASQYGDAMGATVLDSGQHSLRNKIYVRFHDGSQTAADDYLMRVFSTYPERPWTADMIGTGVAYAIVTFKGRAQDNNYSGFPSIKFEVDGHKLMDPRTGTDEFTCNPAVISWNILRGIDIPGGERWGVGATDFALSHVIAAANLCDEQVPVAAGGTRARYRAGLEISVSDEPHEALMEIVKAMGGDVADMGGTWLLSAGEPDGPVLSISDDDIIVTDSRSLKPYPGLDETVNAIHASYPDPAAQWEAKEAVPLYKPEYEARDGGRRLIAEVDFPAVPYPPQVRALMREMLADHRRMRTHVITLPPDALGVKLGEHIAWSSVINGYIGKLFKVVALRIDPVSLCVAMTITERDPADYDYDVGSDGRVPTIPSPQPVVPVISGITGWAVTAVNAGGRPGIRMAWNPEVNARAIAWTIRLAADNSIVSTGSVSDLAAGAITISAGLKPSTAYRVTGRLVLARQTAETVAVTVTTLAIGLADDDFVGGIKKLFRDQGMYAIEYMSSLPATGAFVGQLIFNTTTGKLHRWTGSAWVEVVAGALQGVLDESSFAQGISIPRIVTTLPATGNFVGRLVVLSSDGKLYRWSGSAWTSAVPATDVTGQLTNAQIASIAASKLAGQITGTQISDNAISTPKIAAGAIETAQLAAGAVVTGKLAAGAVTAGNIEAGAVTAGKIATNAITSDKIEANAITTAKIAAGAVAADQIAAGAIVASKMAIMDFTNLVPDDQMQDAAAWGITAASNNVTHHPNTSAGGLISSKGLFQIAPGGVNPTTIVSTLSSAAPDNEYYFSGAVWSGGSADVRVTIQFLGKDGAVLGGKVAGGGAQSGFRKPEDSAVAPAGTAQLRIYYLIPANSYGNAQIQVGTPVIRLKSKGELIVDGTITGNKIVANTITGGLLATSGIITTAAQITGAVIQNAHIENLTIGPDKIQVDGLSNLWNASFADGYTSSGNGVWVEVGRLTFTPYAANTKLLLTGQGNLIVSSDPGGVTGQMRVLINGNLAFQRRLTARERPADEWVSIVGMRRAVAGANTAIVQIHQSASIAMGNLVSLSGTSIYVAEFKR